MAPLVDIKVLIFIAFNTFTNGLFFITIIINRPRRSELVGYRTVVGEDFGNSLKEYLGASINGVTRFLSEAWLVKRGFNLVRR